MNGWIDRNSSWSVARAKKCTKQPIPCRNRMAKSSQGKSLHNIKQSAQWHTKSEGGRAVGNRKGQTWAPLLMSANGQWKRGNKTQVKCNGRAKQQGKVPHTGQNNTQTQTTTYTQTQTANLPRVFAGQVKQNELRIMKQYTKHKPKHLLHFPPPSSTFLYKCGKSLQGKKWPFWMVFPPQVSSVKIYAKLSATAKPKWAERVSLSWCCLVCTCENFSLAIRNYFINNFNCKSLGISFLRLQWAEPSWAESNSTLHFLIVAGQVLRSFISLNVIIVLVTKLADKCLPMGE